MAKQESNIMEKFKNQLKMLLLGSQYTARINISVNAAALKK
jgi:hypothetical protein